MSQMYAHLKTHEVVYVKHVQRFLHRSYISKVIFEWNIVNINILCGLKNKHKDNRSLIKNIHTKYLSPGYHLVPIGLAKAKMTVQTPCGENVDQSELSYTSGRGTKAATISENYLEILIFPSLLRYN